MVVAVATEFLAIVAAAVTVEAIAVITWGKLICLMTQTFQTLNR